MLGVAVGPRGRRGREARGEESVKRLRIGLFAWVLGFGSVALPSPSGGVSPAASEAAAVTLPFEEGRVVGRAEADSLRSWLPRQFFDHRQFFFHEGMAIEIGPPHRDYSPPAVYREATDKNRGRASIGPDGTLVGYVAGQPFPVDAIDCAGDPQAGPRLIWNFVHRWQGFGAQARFQYTYWDRGEKRPIEYVGLTTAWFLKHRPEPQFAAQGGDVFPDEHRFAVVGFEVERPAEVAGLRTLTYRYAESFGSPQQAKPEDSWIYSREIRRVRKVSETQRSAAIAGTEFSFDDLFSFSGLPPQYEWTCLGEAEVLAPTNTRKAGFPYTSDGRYGPSGLSFASDRWELRRAVRIEMKPRDPNHPYERKELWVDRQTFQPLYSFAYDRKGELWKVIYHNHRWSEDDLGEVRARDWYPGWDGVPEPRDLRVVSDAIVNVQTGAGNRLDFWDSHGTPPSLGKLRRMIDVTGLKQAR
jgi:hypothetical protein